MGAAREALKNSYTYLPGDVYVFTFLVYAKNILFSQLKGMLKRLIF